MTMLNGALFAGFAALVAPSLLDAPQSPAAAPSLGLPAESPHITGHPHLAESPHVMGELPLAEPNDHRTSAGRIVDGELRIELEVVLAEWRPRGAEGPVVVTPAFAEVGGPPQVPGPLIRADAGTSVRVTVRNTLERTVEVRGLDRGPIDVTTIERPPDAPPPAMAPWFLFTEALVVPAGEVGEARFTPESELTSIYFGRSEPAEDGPSVPGWVPAGFTDGALEGAFLGGLLVDPPGGEPDPEERFFLVTQWASVDEPGADVTFKMFMNGLSWPFTERLEHAVGDTVRWRLFNATIADHPMHLHGFYFSVKGTGDGDRDEILEPGARRTGVTERLPIMSSLRVAWVPEEPGNWLFHCHLVRHMNPRQRFALEGEVPDVAHDHDMHHMAGMILGITVRPLPDWVDDLPEAARRIDLWTGARAGAYGDHPELGFVLQEGARPPPPDSTRVPGSPLVLHRGEPTEIVVHNRLEEPLSVHWHGLELQSLFDGVGHWSGFPGAVRPPILPGESASVLIVPHRAGTFMYHVHGETGHELAQGLYGPFLVLEPGETWDPERDRVYLLGARGAEIDAPPVVNGDENPPPERFETAETYRLRLLHISPDESKRVRLLRDGEPVRWRPVAKDGADLPPDLRQPAPAEISIDVGETWDFEWEPSAPGPYELEVQTVFYPASTRPPVVQRALFEVVGIDLRQPQSR
jgi:manganese oxidase